MNNDNDIEELLRQYGQDQRQQQRMAGHLRQLAHRQRCRITLVCATLLTVAALALFLHRPDTMCLNNNTPLVAQKLSTPIVLSNTTPRLHSINPVRLMRVAHTNTTNDDLYAQALTEPDVAQIVQDTLAIQDTLITDNCNFPRAITTSCPPCIIPPLSLRTDFDKQPTLNNTNRTAVHPAPARLRFAAAIGASALRQIGVTKSDTEYDNTNASPIVPYNTVHANIGLAYKLACNEKRHLEIGLGLSGSLTQTIVKADQSNGISPTLSTDDGIINHIDPQTLESVHTMSCPSLYITIPLSIDLYPNGNDKSGLTLNIAPSHLLATNTPIAENNLLPNPWKLTCGLGIAIPNSQLRHISLTTNLLPTYSNLLLHEFGIILDF